MKQNKKLENFLKKLLKIGLARTQQEIIGFLKQEGFVINQSKISRLLRKLGAVRVGNEKGEMVYCLPKDPPVPNDNIAIKDLICNVSCNECLIFISTMPGAASLIARILDYKLMNRILGTLAGDDGIAVVPVTVKDLQMLHDEIKEVLLVNDVTESA